jgi:hypothetical protein
MPLSGRPPRASRPIRMLCPGAIDAADYAVQRQPAVVRRLSDRLIPGHVVPTAVRGPNNVVTTGKTQVL